MPQPAVINVGGSSASFPIIMRPQQPNAAMEMFARMQDNDNDRGDEMLLMALLQFAASQNQLGAQNSQFGEELALRREEALRDDAYRGDMLDLTKAGLERQDRRDTFDAEIRKSLADIAVRQGNLQTLAGGTSYVNERLIPQKEADLGRAQVDVQTRQAERATEDVKYVDEAQSIFNSSMQKHSLDPLLSAGSFTAGGFGADANRSKNLYYGVQNFAIDIAENLKRIEDPVRRRKVAQSLQPMVNQVTERIRALDTSNEVGLLPDWGASVRGLFSESGNTRAMREMLGGMGVLSEGLRRYSDAPTEAKENLAAAKSDQQIIQGVNDRYGRISRAATGAIAKGATTPADLLSAIDTASSQPAPPPAPRPSTQPATVEASDLQPMSSDLQPLTDDEIRQMDLDLFRRMSGGDY